MDAASSPLARKLKLPAGARAAIVGADLTRDKGWEPLEGRDLMWLSLVSVDETWLAFGLRPRTPGKVRQAFR